MNETVNKIQHIKGIAFIVAGYSAFAIGDALAKNLGHFFSAVVTVFYMNIFLLSFLICGSSRLGGLQNALRTPQLTRHVFRGGLFAVAIFFGAVVSKN